MFFESRSFFINMTFSMEKQCFWDSSIQNHAESSGNYLKKSVLDPKHAKLDQQPEHGHVHHAPEAQIFMDIPYILFSLCSLDIPYLFPKYIPCMFPCVFLNLFSQQ